MLRSRLLDSLDWPAIGAVTGLVTAGIFTIASATAGNWQAGIWRSQLIWFALAALLFALALLLLARRRPVTLPRRLTFGGLAGALLLLPLLAAWSFAPAGREPPDLEAATTAIAASDAGGDPAPRPPVISLI